MPKNPRIDRNRIGLLGNSQGGYLVPLVAQREPGAAAFAVLLAGPAQTGCEVVKHQLRVQIPGVRTPECAAADGGQ